MTESSAGWWTPRVIGTVIALFCCYVLLDSVLQFGFGRDAGGIVFAAMVLVVTGLVLLAWRWAWFGTIAFLLLALFFGGGPILRPLLTDHVHGTPPMKLILIAVICFVLFGSVALLYWRSWKRQGR